MFEKEAEEYVRKIRHDVINWGGTEPEERFYNEIKFKQAYLAGAELGYNKANEWHFVKDGIMPEENQWVLVYDGSYTVCNYHSNTPIKWLDNYENEVYEYAIIAWREIVPPKEIEEK